MTNLPQNTTTLESVNNSSTEDKNLTTSQCPDFYVQEKDFYDQESSFEQVERFICFVI